MQLPLSVTLHRTPDGAAVPDMWLIGDATDRTIASLPAYGEVDARHIVACVNAKGKAMELIFDIVCITGYDRGVVLLSGDALGDALYKMWRILALLEEDDDHADHG